MNWKRGDRAIYDCPNSSGGAHGMEVTITTELGLYISKADGPIIGHRFDPGFQHPYAKHFCNTPEHFKPIHDDKHKRFHKALIPAEPDYQWNKELVMVENDNG